MGAGVTPSEVFKGQPRNKSKTKADREIAELQSQIDVMKQQIAELIAAQRGQGSGQQSHVPAPVESPVAQNYSCTQPRVAIPEVIKNFSL